MTFWLGAVAAWREAVPEEEGIGAEEDEVGMGISMDMVELELIVPLLLDPDMVELPLIVLLLPSMVEFWGTVVP